MKVACFPDGEIVSTHSKLSAVKNGVEIVKLLLILPQGQRLEVSMCYYEFSFRACVCPPTLSVVELYSTTYALNRLPDLTLKRWSL